jgi:hypothetical protein
VVSLGLLEPFKFPFITPSFSACLRGPSGQDEWRNKRTRRINTKVVVMYVGKASPHHFLVSYDDDGTLAEY